MAVCLLRYSGVKIVDCRVGDDNLDVVTLCFRLVGTPGACRAYGEGLPADDAHDARRSRGERGRLPGGGEGGRLAPFRRRGGCWLSPFCYRRFVIAVLLSPFCYRRFVAAVVVDVVVVADVMWELLLWCVWC